MTHDLSASRSLAQTQQADRLGRKRSFITAGVSTNLFTYDNLDLVSENQNGAVLTRETDTLGRPAGIALSYSPYTLTYGYDAYGRFIAVTAQVHILTHRFTYGYLADSDLVETMANSHGLTTTRTYAPAMPHITRVHNGFTGARTISQYDYTYDALGRRTANASSGEAFTFTDANDLAAFNAYGYNSRSEVTSATRYWGADLEDTSEPVAGQEYAYAYDPIGNHITSAEGDTDRTATYTANALNQYTQRTVPDEKELAGTAITNATVTVNGLATDRHGPWWRHAFEVDNAASAAYTQAVVTAVYNPPGTNDPDVVTSSTGRVFVAETPEAFTYDDDGNLTQDGRFDYAWNGENRLIKAETRDDLPTEVPRVRADYAYDHQGRRVARVSYAWNTDHWSRLTDHAFLYDGWNVIAETIANQQSTITNAYVWGVDLSGTLQGAGGIGGLLSASLDGTAAFYGYDANGNVGQLVATSGDLLAHYDYSPFGETVVSTGPLATDNPFRFSTKWFDNDTGLGDWGYRWYDPPMGRWPNRDPIGEIGGANLFAFVSPMNTYDPLGRIALIDDAAVLLVVAELAAAYACIQILTSDPVQEQCRIVYDSVASGCACACDAFLSATKDAVEVANKHLDTAYEHMGNMLGQTPKGEDPNDRERNWKQWKTTVRKSIENAKKKAAKCTTKAKEELLEKIRELEEKFRKIDENPGPRGDNNQ